LAPPLDLGHVPSSLSICGFSLLIFLPATAQNLGRGRRLSALLTLAFLAGVLYFFGGEAIDDLPALFPDYRGSGLLWPVYLPCLLLFALPFGFNRLMRAPSREGRLLLDGIAGFAMYIGVAEKNRLTALNGPEETPAVFQAVLPYAAALGLAGTWCARFADQMAAGLIASEHIELDAWNEKEMLGLVDAFDESVRAAEALPAPSYSSSDDDSSSSAFSDDGGGSGSGSGGSDSGSGGGGGGGI
jgi:uncharacterized membrane protein YgcG